MCTHFSTFLSQTWVRYLFKINLMFVGKSCISVNHKVWFYRESTNSQKKLIKWALEILHIFVSRFFHQVVGNWLSREIKQLCVPIRIFKFCAETIHCIIYLVYKWHELFYLFVNCLSILMPEKSWTVSSLVEILKRTFPMERIMTESYNKFGLSIEGDDFKK